MTSPLEIVTTIVSVGKAIYDTVQEVKGFKSRRKTLAERIYVIVQPVEVLQNELRQKRVVLPSQAELVDGSPVADMKTSVRPLRELADCIKQVKDFMDNLATITYAEKLVSKNAITSKFDSFNNQLTTLQQSLTLSLQVHLKESFSEDMKKQMNDTFDHYSMLKKNLEDLKEDLDDWLSTITNSTEETNNLVKALRDQIADLQKELKGSQKEYDNLRINYDEFTEVEKLHNGTFGPIYKMKHKHEEMMLVVKKYTDNAEFAISELKDQLNLWKGLRYSRYIIQLYGYSIDDTGRMCFVVEFMSRGTLRSVLLDQTGQDLTWDQRLMMARDCAQGLYAIHYHQGKPMLHRAITSTRFLVDGNYRAKISDNGFVKSQSKITKSVAGELMGDLETDEMIYLCPEETGMEFKRTVKSEIYKFGVILYEIASRKKPFQSLDGESAYGVIVKRIKEGRLEQPPEDAPVALRELIRMCRKKDPADRPSTGSVVTILNDMCHISVKRTEPRV